ncbi:uncharacterized [Tachysurus ichikawai]
MHQEIRLLAVVVERCGCLKRKSRVRQSCRIELFKKQLTHSAFHMIKQPIGRPEHGIKLQGGCGGLLWDLQMVIEVSPHDPLQVMTLFCSCSEAGPDKLDQLL